MKLRITALLILAYTITFAQADTCKVGIYVNSIYDFKLDDKSYSIEFWMWMNYKNDSLTFQNNQDIINSKSTEFTHFAHEKNSGINWVAQKCKAQMMQQWDVTNYPFDRQSLQLVIEDAEHDTSEMIYIADKLNSKLDPAFVTGEWSIERFSIKEGVRTYTTSYGNPSLANTSSYPQIVAEISIKRNNSWLLLIKLLTGAYVAFLISSLVFFVSSANQDSRFALCVGGLFAAIGNKYITESVVPPSSAGTLMDNVHNITFGSILLVVIICIISLRLHESDCPKKKARSLKIDRLSFWLILTGYVVTNIMMIIGALNHRS
ncbi:MAG: hypothetical protein ABIS74_05905 [Ferruginibacter sp.]